MSKISEKFDDAPKFQHFLSGKNLSEWCYIFTENPGKFGLRWNNLTAKEDGFESDAADGFLVGNNEILGAVGCPSLVAESVYNYYRGGEKGNGEMIKLNNYPSRLTVLVGPNKQYDHLRIKFTIVKFQDFFISYKIGGKLKYIPLWQMPNRFHYRIEKTRIPVAEIFNDEIKIKIIDFALKEVDKEDLPVLSRNFIIENLSDETIEDVEIGVLIGNLGGDWAVRKRVSPLGIDISSSSKFLNEKDGHGHPYWSILIENTSKNKQLRFSLLDNCEDLEELNDFFRRDPKNLNDFFDDARNTSGSAWERMKFGSINLKQGNLEKSTETTCKILIVLSSQQFLFDDTVKKMGESGYLKEGIFDSLKMLENTWEEWVNWHNLVPIEVSDPKIFGLIDSLLTMLRCIVNDAGIHMGALYYPHESAYWRDNYWIQNAFLKAGRHDYAVRDTRLFHECWKNDGWKNSYGIGTKSGSMSNSKEMRVEVPLYSVLMVRNLYRWYRKQEFIGEFYDMMKEAIDESIASENNLCVILSDETWIWPAYINEHDYYIDNSLIGLRAYDFGVTAAELMNKGEDKRNWGEKRNTFLKGIDDHLILREQFRFASGIDNNEMQDESMLPTLISRPILLNLEDLLDPVSKNKMNITARHACYNGLSLTWEVMKRTGVIRSHTRTTAIEGNTIGHYLYACSDLDTEYMDAVLDFAIKFSNVTGSVNEIHDMYNRNWGTGKQRIWDSSSLLEGLLHYLFGTVPFYDYFEINPHLPPNVHSSKMANIRMHENEIIITCHKHGENFERNLFIKDIGNENMKKSVFPIPEIEIIKTNLPGKIRVYDNEIALNKGKKEVNDNCFAVTVDIIPKFTKTYTSYENIPILSLENPLTHEGEDWTLVICEDHVENLTMDNYSIQFPAHKISIEIEKITAGKGKVSIKLSVTNQAEKPVIVRERRSREPLEKINPGKKGAIIIAMNQEKGEEVYPFSNPYDHDQPEKIYWKPHPITQNLDEILFGSTHTGISKLLIICDTASLAHARELMASISIIKQKLVPIIKADVDVSIKDLIQKHAKRGINLFVVSHQEETELFQAEIYHVIYSTESIKPESSFKVLQNLSPNFKKQYIFYVKNDGHCYRDTHKLCETLNTYLIPQRPRGNAMYPYGIMTLSDVIGDEINEQIPFSIEVESNEEFKAFIQGEEIVPSKNGFILDTTKPMKKFKRQAPFISIYCVNKFVPFEIAAGGLSTGVHAIKFGVDCESDTPSKIIVNLILPQNFNPIALAGEQRERTLDPTTMLKNPDGTKTLHIILHPGKPVHKFILNKKINPKLRSLDYLFGKFPKFPK